MKDVTKFLTARYDEWERRARDAYPHETGSRDEGQPLDWVAYRRGPGNAEFGLRHVATLRAVLAEHAEIGRNSKDGPICNTCVNIGADPMSDDFYVPYPCKTVRRLADDFSHLPDYRQEWAI
jgi:hypothetical protein